MLPFFYLNNANIVWLVWQHHSQLKYHWTATHLATLRHSQMIGPLDFICILPFGCGIWIVILFIIIEAFSKRFLSETTCKLQICAVKVQVGMD